MINGNHEIIRYFPYEAARVEGWRADIACTPAMEAWHRELAEAAGAPGPDNKQTFELESDCDEPLVVQFWDNMVYVGHAVEPRPGRTYYEFNAQGHRIEARAPGAAI